MLWSRAFRLVGCVAVAEQDFGSREVEKSSKKHVRQIQAEAEENIGGSMNI